MDAKRFNSAYRLGLGIAILYVVAMLIPHVVSYADFVVSGAHRARTRGTSQQQKLSAAKLESDLRQAKPFGPDSQLRCKAAVRHWDYVCSYLPTPRQSSTRLQFGVNVDATRWVKVSRVMPMGTSLPPPQ